MVLQEAIRLREETTLTNDVDTRSLEPFLESKIGFNESSAMEELRGYEERKKVQMEELEVEN